MTNNTLKQTWNPWQTCSLNPKPQASQSATKIKQLSKAIKLNLYKVMPGKNIQLPNMRATISKKSMSLIFYNPFMNVFGSLSYLWK